MREFQIRFRSSNDVLKFVSLATTRAFPIHVGTDSYCVSGTSFMGMFSLDYSHPVKVMVSCSEEDFRQLLQDMEPFLAE